MLPLYFCKWDHPGKHSQPTRGHNLKRDWLFPPEAIAPWVGLLSPQTPFPSTIECWLAGANAGLLQASTTARGSWVQCSCHAQNMLLFSPPLLKSFCPPFPWWSLSLGGRTGGMWYRSPISVWAFHWHLFSALQPVVTFWVNRHPKHLVVKVWFAWHTLSVSSCSQGSCSLICCRRAQSVSILKPS